MINFFNSKCHVVRKKKNKNPGCWEAILRQRSTSQELTNSLTENELKNNGLMLPLFLRCVSDLQIVPIRINNLNKEKNSQSQSQNKKKTVIEHFPWINSVTENKWRPQLNRFRCCAPQQRDEQIRKDKLTRH